MRGARVAVGSVVAAAAAWVLLASAPAAAQEEPGIWVQQLGPARSQVPFTLRVWGEQLVPGQAVSATWTDPGTGAAMVTAVPAGAGGAADLVVAAWKTTTVTVRYADQVVSVQVPVSGRLPAVTVPRAAPMRAARYLAPTDPAAVGGGANVKISALSQQRIASMRGISWHEGCVPLTQLREVRVNYWGADGFRYRGTLIAAAGVARKSGKVFAALYQLRFRLHSMHPVDVYGHATLGPGADDYASMAAGNTSMFNCRFQVGKEGRAVRSPHWFGTAVDLNPWENPYVAPGGVYPNRWWLTRHGYPMQISDRVRHVFASLGWVWGGRYRDNHHFDYHG